MKQPLNTVFNSKGMPFYVKRNLYRLPILSVGYTFEDNLRKTTCVISWYDPINNVVKRTKGVAKCNTDNEPNTEIGKHIAESRCKIAIYNEYLRIIRATRRFIGRKYYHLIDKEIEHLANIVNNL